MADAIDETLQLDTVYISDAIMQTMAGKFFSYEDDWTLINMTSSSQSSSPRQNPIPTKITICKPAEKGGGILAILNKNVIPLELCKLAVEKYNRAGKMISTNRGNAAGSHHRNTKLDASHRYEKGAASNSTIMGYIDSANHKRPCRLTSFSRDYYKDYIEGIPFIKAIDRSFKEVLPNTHQEQLISLKTTAADFQIEDTAFSTVTVNYNFQTALHKDSGDYRNGFGNLIVCQDNIAGGEILFPQYKVAIHLNTGDFLAMDVHEWHCNNPITYNTTTAYRLSFVCYYREKMSECKQINNNILAVTGNLDGKSWDTEVIFRKIFGVGSEGEALPTKECLEEGKPWWRMVSPEFYLLYKYKRYTLYDNKNKRTIHNLLPAYNYVIGLRSNCTIDSSIINKLV
jgi:hypothetical protein